MKKYFKFIYSISDDDSYFTDVYEIIKDDITFDFNLIEFQKSYHYIREKINKQFDKCTIRDFRNLIYKFSCDYYIQNRAILTEYFMGFNILDSYNLARMFVRFEDEKMSRSPENCKKNNELNKIIIYTGFRHTIFMVEFLQSIYPDCLQFDIVNVDNDLIKSDSPRIVETSKKLWFSNAKTKNPNANERFHPKFIHPSFLDPKFKPITSFTHLVEDFNSEN